MAPLTPTFLVTLFKNCQATLEFFCSDNRFPSADLLDCPPGSLVRVAGLAVVHQTPPTAKGHHFITLEDEGGFINIVVRPKIYPKYRTTLRTRPLLIIDGEVQRQGAVINVVLATAIPLT